MGHEFSVEGEYGPAYVPPPAGHLLEIGDALNLSRFTTVSVSYVR